MTLFFVNKTFGLAIDEKLTLRLLSVSKTQKTVLVNRGLEDGLVVGDHAKFFLTTGVVARGVVIKASPSRSIWSIYRLAVPEKVVVDKVMNIKIASPVKLTEDPSKMLYEQMEREKAEVAAGREDLAPEERSDLEALTSESESAGSLVSGTLKKSPWEIFGALNLNSLSGTWTQGEESSTAQSGGMDLIVGIERFFPTAQNIFNKVSLNAFIAMSSSASGGQNQTENSFLGYGGGANYYFYNSPHVYRKLIGFFGGSFGVGTTETTTTLSNAPNDPVTESGATSFYSLGVGSKYYVTKGFAGNVYLDYFSSSSTFEFEDPAEESLALNLSGFRIRAGISYRF